MGRVIGPASDFYRLRVTRYDMGGDVDFDWREDVLWRATSDGPAEEVDIWCLEVVALDEEESVTRLASFASADDAHNALEEVSRDLAAMTKSEFEAVFIELLGEDSEEPPTPGSGPREDPTVDRG